MIMQKLACRRRPRAVNEHSLWSCQMADGWKNCCPPPPPSKFPPTITQLRSFALNWDTSAQASPAARWLKLGVSNFEMCDRVSPCVKLSCSHTHIQLNFVSGVQSERAKGGCKGKAGLPQIKIPMDIDWRVENNIAKIVDHSIQSITF